MTLLYPKLSVAPDFRSPARKVVTHFHDFWRQLMVEVELSRDYAPRGEEYYELFSEANELVNAFGIRVSDLSVGNETLIADAQRVLALVEPQLEELCEEGTFNLSRNATAILGHRFVLEKLSKVQTPLAKLMEVHFSYMIQTVGSAKLEELGRAFIRLCSTGDYAHGRAYLETLEGIEPPKRDSFGVFEQLELWRDQLEAEVLLGEVR